MSRKVGVRHRHRPADASAGEEPSDNPQVGATAKGRQPDWDDTAGDEGCEGQQGGGLPQQEC